MWQALVEAGLDPKDAYFYLAVLRGGQATVAEAAREAHVSRTSGYDIARRLQARGPIRRVESGPGEQEDLRTQSHLVANDLSHRLTLLRERLESLDPSSEAESVATVGSVLVVTRSMPSWRSDSATRAVSLIAAKTRGGPDARSQAVSHARSLTDASFGRTALTTPSARPRQRASSVH